MQNPYGEKNKTQAPVELNIAYEPNSQEIWLHSLPLFSYLDTVCGKRNIFSFSRCILQFSFLSLFLQGRRELLV